MKPRTKQISKAGRWLNPKGDILGIPDKARIKHLCY